MNIAFLLKQYFPDKENVSIDVFDSHSLNDVYQQVLQTLTSHFEIEVSILQALSYCFYEILDNVHIHSGKTLGTTITHFDALSMVSTQWQNVAYSLHYREETRCCNKIIV